jgi:hypothetical protein
MHPSVHAHASERRPRLPDMQISRGTSTRARLNDKNQPQAALSTHRYPTDSVHRPSHNVVDSSVWGKPNTV